MASVNVEQMTELARAKARELKNETRTDSTFYLGASDISKKLNDIPGYAALGKANEEAVTRAFIDEFNKPAGGRRTRLASKFSRCVKKVRKTVSPRKGSTKESAAIGICVKSVLHTRGRTIKRYSKKRLVTQKRK